MAYRSQRKFKQLQREYEFSQDKAADRHLDPQEPMIGDEWESDYSEYAWDRIDAEASGKRVGEWR